MYPNPQDALPLPSRPNLDQYRKLAKDLAKACKSGDAAAVREWTVKWLNVLATRLPDSDRSRHPGEIDRRAHDVEQFARTRLSGRHDRPKCALTDAQFVIARAHGLRMRELETLWDVDLPRDLERMLAMSAARTP